MNKQHIKDESYGGERPLFSSHNLILDHVTILPGESSLKECSGIEALHCEFTGKYPFWHNEDVLIKDCIFRDGARAAIWYSRNLHMIDTLVEAPKMFRDMDGIKLDNVQMPNALETFWHCSHVELHQVDVNKGDYIFMHGSDLVIHDFRLTGNYSFQYCKNVEIHHAEIHSKDAFWNTENVTIYDSVLDGEYLGWHSKNLRLINCRISGTQPLCYATNLIMENCTMEENSDLAFEYSSLKAEINGVIHSIKNPRSGFILADGYGEIIMDQHGQSAGKCLIETRNMPTGAGGIDLKSSQTSMSVCHV